MFVCVHLLGVSDLDLNHAVIGVVSRAGPPLVLTDDVKFKFHCSDMCHSS